MNIEELKKSENFFKILMGSLESNVILVNQDIKIESVNPFLQNMINKDLKQIEGKKCGNALGCHYAIDEDKECGETSFCKSCNLRKTIISTLANKSDHSGNVLSREFYLNGEKIKKYFLYSCKHVRINSSDMALLIMNDVTELEESRRMMEKMALTDDLTGLFNRRYIFNFLENKEIQKDGFSIIIGDIDHFKKINDTYGHPLGDDVLKEISNVIKAIIGKDGVVSRFGGEEFLIVLPKKTSKDAYIYAERIRIAIESLVLKGCPSGSTISLGVAEYQQGENISNVIKLADELLYLAKKLGRNMTKIK